MSSRASPFSLEFVAAPHERSAEPAKRMHDTEHAGDDTRTQRRRAVSRSTRDSFSGLRTA
jgi:hypothetical protein